LKILDPFEAFVLRLLLDQWFKMRIATFACSVTWLVFAISSLALSASPQEATPVVAEQDTVDFQLDDFRGRSWSMAEFQERPIVVVVFLGTECPLAATYSLRVQELADKYQERGVQFLAIDSNVQDSLEEMSAFARRQKLEVPFLKDSQAKVADQLGATRTPEAFVLNERREVAYRGRVDDQYGIGYTQKSPQSREVADAIEALLQKKDVVTSRTEAVGCLIGRQRTSAADSSVTYASHVAPILNNHCVRCHREGQIGPFSLDNYANAAAWSEMIGEVIRDKRMPPWHADPAHGKFANDCSLSAEDEKTLLAWVAGGAAEGDPTQTPAPPQFVSGWQLPKKPDYVCDIMPKPYKVKATGDIPYKHFVVEPKFTEDKWVRAAEMRPGCLGVVHHILCFVVPADATRLEQEIDGFLVGYVPGMLPPALPDGYAKKIKAGSKLVFQVHFTPNGREQLEQSQLGLVFADDASVTHEVLTTCAVNPKITIPANDPNYTIKARNRFPLGEWPILGMMPHMHLRGKSFRYEAILPDGKREVLLDVSRFDFNWQISYQLAEPLTLPARTRIECVASYDNSSANLNNPDPSQTVRWGDQTWEEMMIGYFDVAIPKAEAEKIRDKMLRR
jgi:peroxiredoxin